MQPLSPATLFLASLAIRYVSGFFALEKEQAIQSRPSASQQKGRGFRLDEQEDFPKAKGTRRKMVSTEKSYPLAHAWEVGVEYRLS